MIGKRWRKGPGIHENQPGWWHPPDLALWWHFRIPRWQEESGLRLSQILSDMRHPTDGSWILCFLMFWVVCWSLIVVQLAVQKLLVWRWCSNFLSLVRGLLFRLHHIKDGKLRLLYEGAPMSFIMEQAGGKAGLENHTVEKNTSPWTRSSLTLARSCF